MYIAVRVLRMNSYPKRIEASFICASACETKTSTHREAEAEADLFKLRASKKQEQGVKRKEGTFKPLKRKRGNEAVRQAACTCHVPCAMSHEP